MSLQWPAQSVCFYSRSFFAHDLSVEGSGGNVIASDWMAACLRSATSLIEDAERGPKSQGIENARMPPASPSLSLLTHRAERSGAALPIQRLVNSYLYRVDAKRARRQPYAFSTLSTRTWSRLYQRCLPSCEVLQLTTANRQTCDFAIRHPAPNSRSHFQTKQLSRQCRDN